MTGKRTKLKQKLANPILLKEMYQSLHSKKFLAALWLLLLASLFTYAVIYLGSTGRGCGDDMFTVFSIFTYLMGVCVLPYLAFSTLSQEVEGGTIELVNITTLNSTQHVRGRMMASLAKLGLLYAVLGPFAVTAFVFRGIGVQSILIVLFSIFVMSVAACALAVFFGALTSIEKVRTFAKWSYLAVLGFAVLGVLTMLGQVFFGLGDISVSFEALVGIGIYAVIAWLAAWLCLAAAANILTFKADRCWCKTKIIALVMALAFCGWPWVLIAAGKMSLSPSNLYPTQIPAALVVGVVGLVWITEEHRVSRRWEKRLEEHGMFYRLLTYPLQDGRGPTAAFLLFTALVMGGVYVSALSLPLSWLGLVAPAMLLSYVLFFSTLSWGGTRLLPQKYRNAWGRRVILLALVVVNIMASVLLLSSGYEGGGSGVLGFVTNGLLPLHYVSWLDDLSILVVVRVLAPLALPAFVGVTYHLIVGGRHLRRHLNGQFE